MTADYSVKKCDVLIIGGGGAGGLAAVEAAKISGLKITLASKGPVGKSGLTPTANGGTAFHRAPQDTFNDMITGGRYLNDQGLVWFMANEIYDAIEQIKDLGIEITRIRDISVCVPSDVLMARLRKEISQAPNIDLLEDVLITRLIATDGRISGATALNIRTGEFYYISAKAVILATGGLAGELWTHTSNNPFGITTDSSGAGHGMAYLAGAELIDMEMVQFVPLPANPQCLHLRYFPDFWTGPYLNRMGENIDPHLDLHKGRSYSHQFIQNLCREIETGNGPICVDKRESERFVPTVKIKSWGRRRKLIQKLNIDPHENRIEIIIGAHFGMGGVKVNPKTETTLPGLFAAGEIMGGVHGGLRMPGYSFSQMIVFGLEAGKQAARYAAGLEDDPIADADQIETEKQNVFNFLQTKESPLSLVELKKQLNRIMDDDVFVFRDKSGLEHACRAINEIKQKVPRLAIPGFKRFNLDWMRAIEFALMVVVAESIVRSALTREESRGFHYRRDFPDEDNPHWLKHTVARQDGGKLKIEICPVELDRLKPED
jgi:succinate dehydrogenase/fumarate reductase flavoprotein subunit